MCAQKKKKKFVFPLVDSVISLNMARLSAALATCNRGKKQFIGLTGLVALRRLHFAPPYGPQSLLKPLSPPATPPADLLHGKQTKVWLTRKQKHIDRGCAFEWAFGRVWYWRVFGECWRVLEPVMELVLAILETLLTVVRSKETGKNNTSTNTH